MIVWAWAIEQDLVRLKAGYKADVNTIFTKDNYDSLKRRNQLQVVRSGGNGRTALVAYDSLPSRFKQQIVERFGDPYEQHKNWGFRSHLEYDKQAAEYDNNYTLDGGSPLPEKNAREYIANASILNAIRKMLKETRGGERQDWPGMGELP